MRQFCTACKKVVEPQRRIDVATMLVTLFTGGLWLFLLPFYPKSCPHCQSIQLRNIPPAQARASADPGDDEEIKWIANTFF